MHVCVSVSAMAQVPLPAGCCHWPLGHFEDLLPVLFNLASYSRFIFLLFWESVRLIRFLGLPYPAAVTRKHRSSLVTHQASHCLAVEGRIQSKSRFQNCLLLSYCAESPPWQGTALLTFSLSA